jgi:hypothetical protein
MPSDAEWSEFLKKCQDEVTNEVPPEKPKKFKWVDDLPPGINFIKPADECDGNEPPNVHGDDTEFGLY